MSPKRSEDVNNPASGASSSNSPVPATTSTSTNPPQVAGKKRRASGSGSRGVANLTPEQLAKKRANDREAQRAIRERTKNTIETLEKRIQELTSQQPYQELQQAIQQKELVESENADIKRRLAAVINLIQPLLAGTSYGDSTSQYDVHGPYKPSIHSALTREDQAGQNFSSPVGSVESQQTIGRTYTGQWQGAPSSGQNSRGDSLTPAQNENVARGRRLERPSGGTIVPGLLRTTSAERQALGLLPVGRPEIQAGDHVDEGRRPISLPADSHIILASGSPADSTQFSSGTSPPSQYSTIPTHIPPSCLLDGLLLDFISERRQMAASGATEEELVGGPFPDFNAIMHPEHKPLSRGISKVFVDILSTFPDIHAPPEKIATYYGMFLTMRWHVCPTQENYDRLPTWLRPTSWQILTPHPIWIDHLPWPEMREELVRSYERYPFENFFVPFTKTLSVNWPYDPMDIFMPQKQGETELQLTPTFLAHFSDLKNWSLGSQFSHAFPYLSTHVRIVDHAEKSES